MNKVMCVAALSLSLFGLAACDDQKPTIPAASPPAVTAPATTDKTTTNATIPAKPAEKQADKPVAP